MWPALQLLTNAYIISNSINVIKIISQWTASIVTCLDNHLTKYAELYVWCLYSVYIAIYVCKRMLSIMVGDF